MMTHQALKTGGMKEWLLADTPTSAFQAWAGRAYLGLLAFMKNRLAVLGLLIIGVLVVIAVLAPVIAPYDPVETNIGNRLQPLSFTHYFGTDEMGRDIFSRIVWGSRLTFYVIGLVAIIAAPVGILVGTGAGYFGGIIDTILMRITDIFLAFPKLILALAFVSALGPGIENAIIAISITSWPPYARIARAETITIRNCDFIKAIRLQGASALRIIVGHIMPLCLPSLIIRVTLDMAGIILTAAGLGFLGLGAQPPSPEWGAMTSSGRTYIIDHWWLITMPGTAIFIVSLAFNLLGDGLREVLDPRSDN
ncbi:MAG: ABC transporter permease [Desulfobacter sp.]|jgi:peptide/nickel transport system permease protein|uniref:nickel transporter permease n=1 Tax=uncultured Desulfobacter sp. TaxID=240139 RepID=UPI0029C75553|nr:nickel transporter permease [uncultured Desulfobacter sp.]MCW8800376.1 ABC transporter permease [Desulfobacter sp.]